MGLEVEYLIAIKQEDDFCKNEEAFINFLCVDITLTVYNHAGNKTIKDGSSGLEVQFEIICYEIPEKGERIFNLKMLCHDETKIENFTTITRKIKKVSLKINPGQTQINTIQDDIGTHYALLAYPIIHNLENLMRKLIAKFMVLNVGMNWFKEAIHNDITFEKGKRSNIVTDYVQNLDFIELSDVLFKPYRSIQFSEVESAIDKTEDSSELDMQLLKKFLPRSNWERYFSKIIQIEGKVLMDKWNTLYEIRNDVAHNRFLTKGKMDELKSLIAAIHPAIDRSIASLDQIQLSPLDVNIITKSILESQLRESIYNAFAFNKSLNNGSINLLKVAKEFNIGLSTAAEFLNKKGLYIEARPNAKLTEEMYVLLKAEFKLEELKKNINFKKSQKHGIKKSRNDLQDFRKNAN